MRKVSVRVFIFQMMSVFGSEGNVDTSLCFGCTHVGKLHFVIGHASSIHTLYILNTYVIRPQYIRYTSSIHTLYVLNTYVIRPQYIRYTSTIHTLYVLNTYVMHPQYLRYTSSIHTGLQIRVQHWGMISIFW